MLVACVKVGATYTSEHVNRLARAVARHAGGPRFLCLTDDPQGVECDTAPIGTDLPGWWAKLVLFRPHPALAGERVVYLDLDTVLVGSAEFLLEYAGPLAVLRSFLPPSRYGSAVMSIAPGAGGHAWERFTPDVLKRFYGDQDWLEEQVPESDFWQDVAPGRIGSYKVDRLEDGPQGFSVVCFHGRPRVDEVGGWVSHAWR